LVNQQWIWKRRNEHQRIRQLQLQNVAERFNLIVGN